MDAGNCIWNHSNNQPILVAMGTAELRVDKDAGLGAGHLSPNRRGSAEPPESGSENPCISLTKSNPNPDYHLLIL
jgi:hypothetical protein